MVDTKSKITAGLIGLILASAGGVAFLEKNPNPTLRDVYAACEKGDLVGIACCEDINHVTDLKRPLDTCGLISPKNPDPFGVRKALEDEFDRALEAEKKGFSPDATGILIQTKTPENGGK